MDIKVFADFRVICGGKIVPIQDVEGLSILEVLNLLISRFPDMKDELFTESNEIKPMVHVFVNGKNIMYLNGLETIIHESDTVALFPPVAGG